MRLGRLRFGLFIRGLRGEFQSGRNRFGGLHFDCLLCWLRRACRAFLARRFPGLAARPVLEARVCQYESTPDRHFLIDRHPAWENAWLVGGGSGHGFKHGPVIGETVAGLVTGRPPDPAIGDRFAFGRPRQPEPGVRTAGHEG